MNYFSVCFSQDSRQQYIDIIKANKADTAQVDALNELYKLDRRSVPQTAKENLDKAFELAVKIGYKSGEAYALNSYGDFYMFRGEHDKAEKAFKASMKIYRELRLISGYSAGLNGLGVIATRRGDFSIALDYYIKAAELKEAIQDSIGMASAYQNIGGIHNKQKRYDKAYEYFEKSLKIKEATSDSSGMVITLNAISTIYHGQGDHRKALKILLETYELAKRVSDPYETASIINNIGVQYHVMGELDSVGFYYKKALAIYEQIEVKQELALQYINLGGLELLQNNPKKAVDYFNSSLSISSKIGGTEFMVISYEGLSDSYKKLGDYKSALDWQNKYHSLKDSISGENVQNQLNEIQEKYEAEIKDREIAELEIKEAEVVLLAKNRMAWLIVLLTVSVSSILTLLFYFSKRKATEKQRRIELEQKALRSQMNPHFIFNSLGAIQEMYMSGEMDLANNYMGDFGKLMRKILQNSGMNHINVKEELEMLTLYLDLEKGRTNGLLEYTIEIDERIDQFGTKIPPLVIQPFVENAIWHGILPKKTKGKILVKLYLETKDDSIVCVIEDNGVGMNAQTKTSDYESKGMKITEQRLGSKIKIEDLNPGTRITIKIHT